MKISREEIISISASIIDRKFTKGSLKKSIPLCHCIFGAAPVLLIPSFGLQTNSQFAWFV
jgi:hypothetical protein